MPAYRNGRMFPRTGDTVYLEGKAQKLERVKIPGSIYVNFQGLPVEIGAGIWERLFRYDFAAQKWFPLQGVTHRFDNRIIEFM